MRHFDWFPGFSQVNLHSLEQLERLESTDLAGVLERGPQSESPHSADSNTRNHILESLRIPESEKCQQNQQTMKIPQAPNVQKSCGFCRQVRSLVTLLKPQMAQQHQDDGEPAKRNGKACPFPDFFRVSEPKNIGLIWFDR